MSRIGWFFVSAAFAVVVVSPCAGVDPAIAAEGPKATFNQRDFRDGSNLGWHARPISP